MPNISRPYVRSRVRPQSQSPIVHGTTTGYRTHGCHCGACAHAAAKANARYLMSHQRSHVPALGASRRILSLGTVGYSHRDIAEAAGVTDKTVQRIIQNPQGLIHRDTHAAVAQAFDRLAIAPPPVLHPRWRSGFGPAQMAMVVDTAKAAGGVPPMLWDDSELDDPDGQPVVDEVTQQRGRIDIPLLVEHIHRGTTDTAMADLFGVAPDSLYVALRRKGHEDAADRLLVWSGKEAHPNQRRTA